MQLPVESVVVFHTFSPLFSQSVWSVAQELLVGAILAPGKRTISAILRVLGRREEDNFQRFHRVLNRAQWSSLQAAGLLLRLLVQSLAALGPLCFGLDETIERRWGAQIRARGIYRDAARSSKSVTNKTSGLRWLSVQLLVHIPWAQRLWALPFLTVLAPSQRYYENRGRPAKTLLDCARQALRQVKRWCPNRVLIFVADSTYAALELLAFAQKLKVTLITPLRLDARLYEPAPPRSGRKGRPRKKGQRLPGLNQVLADPNTCWQPLTVQWHGYGPRRIEIVTGTALWYYSGIVVPLRWVLVRDPNGEFETRALLSTDPDLLAQQIVEYYTRRWQVEVTFEEVRAHLGVETQRQWNDWAIVRTTPALLGLFSIVTLLAQDFSKRSDQELQARGAAWYDKEKVTFSDALACVRRHLWPAIYGRSNTEPDRPKFTDQLVQHLADLLCYAQ